MIRYYKVDLGRLVEALRNYFTRADVPLAYLFGSALRRDYVRDVDVAVYERSFERLVKMGVELEDLLKIPVDVVPIQELPPAVRIKVLTEGIPLVVKRRWLVSELLKISIGELEDLNLAVRTRRD